MRPKPPYRSHVVVTASLHVNDLMDALREATINRDDFDARPWALADADDLEAAARLIRRELAALDAGTSSRRTS